MLRHAQALLISAPKGATDYIEGDAREPDAPMCLRSRAELESFFDGLELLEPGVVSCSQWRPPVSDIGRPPPRVYQFGGLGRKP